MSLDQNKFSDLHETNNTSETKGGLKFPVESTEEVQKATSGIAKMANAVLHDTPVSQDQVNKTKDTLKNLTFIYDERGKEVLLTPLWPKLEESYAHMKDTLEDYGYQEYLTQLPSAEELRAYVLKLSPVQLQAISKMGKPTVLVCTPDALEEKKNKLDANKKYENKEGEQGDTYFEEEATCDLWWGILPTKLTISIVDRQSEQMRGEGFVGEDSGEKYFYIQQEYKKKGFKMISVSEYLHLAMGQLYAYELTKVQDNSAVDLEQEFTDMNTAVVFDGGMKRMQIIMTGCWDKYKRKFCVERLDPILWVRDFQSRPSLEVWSK